VTPLEAGVIATLCRQCNELQFVNPQSAADNCKCDNKDQRVSYTRVKGLKKK